MDVELEGRELDAAVAERVMGWKHIGRTPGPPPPNWGRDERGEWSTHCGDFDDWESPEGRICCNCGCMSCVPRYSADIAAAWEVQKKASYFSLERTPGIALWDCEYALPDVFIQRATAPTAPLAICRAALKAMEATDAPD